jgi:gas vesicle protein
MIGGIIGFIIGVVATILIVGWSAKNARLAVELRQNAQLDRLRVAAALRYFGQIANRQSIQQARKLANDAIKEIG